MSSIFWPFEALNEEQRVASGCGVVRTGHFDVD